MKTVLPHSINAIWRWDLLLFIVSTLPFYLFPQIDLWVSGLFYTHHDQFIWKHHPLVIGLYLIFGHIHWLLIVLFIGGLIYCVLPKQNAGKRYWRKRLSFLMITLILGPGLLVNTVLKDHSFGRPRPIQIEQFAGHDDFAPVLHYSGECRHNCSFVSGHASIAFYFIVLAWVFKKRRLFWLGVGLGSLVGFIRILQGAHFLSDIVFAFWVDYIVCLTTASAFQFQFFRTKITPRLSEKLRLLKIKH
ncbi:phosphatase PAP2 family protein [Celerinatantimonas sp. YJH-8]|uniref:phosphatase PAP2 family protein n=1 Tax=Celerinatantimonas sp. YJH-8 TaxID=3228714 RepID=UPI0038CAA244